MNNRTQAVRLPSDVRFPASVKKVEVRVLGRERIITPIESQWDSFFLDDVALPSADFMEVRDSQTQSDREPL